MKPSELVQLLRNPTVKKEISRQATDAMSYAKKKENANSKQAERREKRG